MMEPAVTNVLIIVISLLIDGLPPNPILQLPIPTKCNSPPWCVLPNLNSRSYPPWRVWSGCAQLCHPLGCQWLPWGNLVGALRVLYL